MFSHKISCNDRIFRLQVKEAVLAELQAGSVSYAETCRIALKAINPDIHLTLLQIQPK